MHLASQAKAGLTTLPHDQDVLLHRLEETERSFSVPLKEPRGDTFLFGMEDSAGGRLVGVCGLVSKIGGFQPHWTYGLKEETIHSKTLNSIRHVQYLELMANHDGPSEIGTLFMLPECRGQDGGRLLSLSRFMFLAAHPQGFEREVIAEMRGRVSEAGESVFWEAVGRHFFQVDFAKADLMAMKDKHFIDELMPRHPIYVPLLPKEAQMVIGEVHDNTVPARRLLEQEGFRFRGEVDIFEAGPVLSCLREDIRVVKSCTTVKYGGEGPKEKGRSFLVAKFGEPKDFRVIVTEGHWEQLDEGDCIHLSSEEANILEVEKGASLMISPIRSRVKS
jgi:arginine N-succinyltransferase